MLTPLPHLSGLHEDTPGFSDFLDIQYRGHTPGHVLPVTGKHMGIWFRCFGLALFVPVARMQMPACVLI